MHCSANTHNIECKFQDTNGFIERLLRVVRVRGFRVNDMQIHSCADIYTAKLTLTGERAVQNLKSQLEKLVDMIEIEVLEGGKPSSELLEECA